MISDVLSSSTSQDIHDRFEKENVHKFSIFFEEVGATPIKKNGPKMSGDDERILLNVGGVRHETHVSTLRCHPYTRLSRLADLHASSAVKKDEYFFDRHPSVFNSVIDYYRSGKVITLC